MKLKFRKITHQLHLWLGLTFGLIVFIMAITGCILAFEEKLKQFTHPQRYFVENIGNKKLPLSDLILKAEKALPENLKVKRVQMYSDPSKTYIFRTLKIDKNAHTYWGTYLYYYRVYINPYTGKIHEVENAKKDFFEIVLNLHRRFLLGEKIGKTITGYSAFMFAVILFSGLIIWYPRKINKNTLKRMFFIKISANWKRVNYDIHNVLGFYVLVPLLIISYSSLIWNFENIDEWVKKTLNGKVYTEQKIESEIPSDGYTDQKNILDMIGNKAMENLTDKKSALISFPRTENGTYYAELTYDDRHYRNEQYYFDQYSGKILKYKSYRDSNIGYGTALRNRNYDLHTGSILGFFGRIIYFFVAIIATSLPITGFIIYINKKRKKP